MIDYDRETAIHIEVYSTSWIYMEFCCIIAGSDTLPTVNACEIAACESRRYNVAASSILSWRDTIFWGVSVIALRVLTYGNAVSTSHTHVFTKIYPPNTLPVSSY